MNEPKNVIVNWMRIGNSFYFILFSFHFILNSNNRYLKSDQVKKQTKGKKIMEE